MKYERSAFDKSHLVRGECFSLTYVPPELRNRPGHHDNMSV